MSEICLDCFNKDIENEKEKLTKRDVVLEYDLCESCGEWKPCVIVIKERGLLASLKYLILDIVRKILSRF